jgi:hypothetical protein
VHIKTLSCGALLEAQCKSTFSEHGFLIEVIRKKAATKDKDDD